MYQLQKVNVLELHTRDEVTAKASDVQNIGGIQAERSEKAFREHKIREKLLGGLATTFNWAIAEIPALRMRLRVNGQHSSQVFLDLDDSDWALVKFPVVIIEQVFTCDTLIDASVLFEQFDPAWSSRSKEDLVGVHLANEDDLYGRVSPYAAARATQGIAWYESKVEGKRRATSGDELQIVHENADIHPFLRFCGKDGIDLDRKRAEMGQRPVVAAMYHTTRRGTDEDRAFWKRVSGGKQSFDEDSYEYKLAVFLDQVRSPEAAWSPATRKLFRNGKKPDDVEIFATCIRVFAAYKFSSRITEAFARVKERDCRKIAAMYALPEEHAA
jgi:hypothetical protein